MKRASRRVSVAGHPVSYSSVVQHGDVTKSWRDFVWSTDPESWSLFGAIKRKLPITDPTDTVTFDLVELHVSEPQTDPETCRQFSGTYEAAVEATIRTVLWGTHADADTIGTKYVVSVHEKRLPLGTVPLMNRGGTFVINGTARTIMSQIRRAAGSYFRVDRERGLFKATIMTERGPWTTIKADKRLTVALDKRKGVNALDFVVNVCGYSVTDALRGLAVSAAPARIVDGRILVDASHSKFLGRFMNRRAIRDMTVDSRVDVTEIFEDKLCLLSFAFTDGGSQVGVPGSELKTALLRGAAGEILLGITEDNGVLLRTIRASECAASIDAVESAEVRRLVSTTVGNSAVPAALLTAQVVGSVGRSRENNRFSEDVSSVHVTPNDVLRACRMVLQAVSGRTKVGEDFAFLGTPIRLMDDDIDSLENRRVQLAGESTGRYLDTILSRMIRGFRESLAKAAAEEDASAMIDPARFPIGAVGREIRQYFSGDAVQLADETNPLSTVAHSTRITATGTGGLTQQSASLAVRDVHPTQFGRVCPVETPEGGAVGLVTSRACGARLDDNGFLVTPYMNLATGDVEFLNAAAERQRDIVIVPYTEARQANPDSLIHARRHHSSVLAFGSAVTHTEVHPAQMLSVSAACIPFLGHCDAQRALMGANMQRQALPVYGGEAPLVGTGMEQEVIRSSGHDVVATGLGTVAHVDADRIFVWYEIDGLRVHRLSVFTPNNHTVVAHSPVVNVGDTVRLGQVLATGMASDHGELAIGANLVTAYMPWHGYNFEDAIVIRAGVVAKHTLTTVVSETFTIEARVITASRTVRHEEITADMPDIAESDLLRLDESGVIAIGSTVRPGDILVGKVRPKTVEDDEVSDADRLMEFLLGTVAVPVKSEPLRYPAGSVSGVVTDVRIVRRVSVDAKTTRTEVQRDTRLDKIEAERAIALRVVRKKFSGKANASTRASLIDAISEQYATSLKSLTSEDLRPDVVCQVSVTVTRTLPLERGDKLALRYGSKGCVSILVPDEDMPIMPDGRPVDVLLNPLGVPSRMNIGQVFEAHLSLAAWKLGEKVAAMADRGAPTLEILDALKPAYTHDREELRRVFAMGAKNRAGFLEFCQSLREGIKMASPPFNDAPEHTIRAMLKAADQPVSGQLILRDGQTGEPFENPITVGRIYVMRLHHLVAKKMHARSTGPYSVSTQQPLGGQANFGGQRVGEMEVWALQAYGAAFTLHEMTTIKSDDVAGRSEAYKAMVKGEPVVMAERPPASSNLLMYEIKGLCFDLETLDEQEAQAAYNHEVAGGRRTVFSGVSEDYYVGDETLTLKVDD